MVRITAARNAGAAAGRRPNVQAIPAAAARTTRTNTGGRNPGHGNHTRGRPRAGAWLAGRLAGGRGALRPLGWPRPPEPESG